MGIIPSVFLENREDLVSVLPACMGSVEGASYGATWLSMFTFMCMYTEIRALFMPYDHKNTTPDGLPLQQMKSLLEEVNQLHCQKRCMIGSGGGSVGYFAHGTATDFMYDVVRVPMAFTFEIYGDVTAPSSDCFKMFNPTDLASYNVCCLKTSQQLSLHSF
ncbi:carboxypeptidase a6-like protein [Trifolium pratense]|uniref:Carboxypeptidase a6-like protein n=1 Tax=Trifolium pratense TaxID=57577 RepID=A0A2K3PNB4_TRIPR|nr:carboxypeptidase a6-like protein [Trifolium pratense]